MRGNGIRDGRKRETSADLACEDSASYSKCERMQIPYLMSGIFKKAERWMEDASGTEQSAVFASGT